MNIVLTVLVAVGWLWLTRANFIGMARTEGEASLVHGNETGGRIAWGMFFAWELIFTVIAALILWWIW